MQHIRRLTCTMRQGAEVSGLSVRKLYDKIGSGELDTVTVDRRRLIVWDSLERLLLGPRPPARLPNAPQRPARNRIRKAEAAKVCQ